MDKKRKIEEIERIIINFIQHKKIDDQAQLQEMLKAKGILLSQATLSRLIKKLEIVKKGGQYVLLSQGAMLGFTIVSIKSNESGILIIKTAPGQAQGVAAFLDQKYGLEDVENQLKNIFLGTIAGDDTVFVALVSAKEMSKSVQLIKQDFGMIG